MRLHLDEDVASVLLARLLTNAGHDVRTHAESQLSGKNDAVHLTHTIRDKRILLSRNSGDFEELHELLMEGGGHHPGILIVRSDNDPTRDMSARAIVRAVGNLERSGWSPADSFVILNQYR